MVNINEGEWLEPENKYLLPKCSICGNRSYDAEWYGKGNYCSACGAKMNDKKQEGNK